MIIDTLILNTKGILLCSLLLYVFYLNDRNIYLLLCTDIVFTGIPFCTMIVIKLYYLNKNIFKVINNTFINELICLVFYYFIFGIVLYSIYNEFNYYIVKLLINNLGYNLIFYIFGLLWLRSKYNLVVNYEK